MKAYEVDKFRNLGLVGHQDTGKTSFLEVVLYDTKQVSRLARVDDSNSNLDFTPEEIERRITIKSALVHAEWKGHKLNFVDTPGYDDFVVEEMGALAAVEIIDWPVALLLGVGHALMHNEHSRVAQEIGEALEDA